MISLKTKTGQEKCHEIRDLVEKKHCLKDEIKELKTELEDCLGEDCLDYIAALEKELINLEKERSKAEEDIWRLSAEVVEVWNKIEK